MPRKIVFVIIDDIGKDQDGYSYPGFSGGHMPNLAARIQSGVWFPKATVQPSCSPSRSSWITGLSPSRHGIGIAIGGVNSGNLGLDPTQPTLPKVLTNAGYRVEAVGKYHMAPLTVQLEDLVSHVNNLGFDHWEGIVHNPPGYGGGVSPNYNWVNTTVPSVNTQSAYLTTYTADRAISLLSALTEPFFFYVAFNAAHLPFHCAPASFGFSCGSETTAEQYVTMKQALDVELERFFDAIDLSDTTVIVIGDNGTANPVVEGYPGAPVGDPGNQSKQSAYYGGIAVPLTAFGYGVSVGQTCPALVQATDIPATILELAGLDPEVVMPSASDSISFAPLLADPTLEHTRKFSYAERFSPNTVPPVGIDALADYDRSAFDGRYHLVENTSAGTEKLFDLVTDEFELSELDLENLTTRQRQSYDDLRWVIDSRGRISRVQTKKRRRMTVQRQS